MIFKNETDGKGLFQGIAMAYFILTFHVILIASVAFLILILSGVVNYLAWILALCGSAVILIGYAAYRKLRHDKEAIGDILRSSEFTGRPVEVSLLGGMAAMKIGTSNVSPPAIDVPPYIQRPLLEDPTTLRLQQLNNLADLLKEGLITREEYEKTKRQLLNPS